jgi:preprotein translocase subunit SecG
MQELILLIHVFACITLIVLVLMQHGKGADVGAVLGSGASQTIFGSRGSASFMVRLTVLVAIVFFVTSLALGYFASRHPKAIDRIESLAKKADSAAIVSTTKESSNIKK